MVSDIRTLVVTLKDRGTAGELNEVRKGTAYKTVGIVDNIVNFVYTCTFILQEELFLLLCYVSVNQFYI